MLILGYTTRDHLLLDLDETSLSDVVGLARLIMQSWPKVGDCLVIESSTPSKRSYLKYDDKGIPHEKWVYQNYHLVFDAPIGYEACVAVIDTLVDLDILNPEYKQIRMFRGDMTLRVSPKWLQHRTIPSPKIVSGLVNPSCHANLGGIESYLHLYSIGRRFSQPPTALSATAPFWLR
jgi:hypothetical protein